VGDRDAASVRDLAQLVHRVVAALEVHRRHRERGAATALAGGIAARVLAGEEAARERAPDQRAELQTSVAGPLYQVAIGRFRERHPDWTVSLKLHPWSDPTAGVLEGRSDLAFVGRPVPGQERLAHRTLWTEPRHVALWCTHRLAERAEVRLADLLDEPFVALPPAAGVLRDHWLAVEHRNGHPVRVGAEAETPDETFEAVAAQPGVALLSAGNAETYARPGIVTRPVVDVGEAELAVAWQASDERAIVAEFADAAEEAIRICATPATAARRRCTGAARAARRGRRGRSRRARLCPVER
jgi:LysR substrate binding domain